MAILVILTEKHALSIFHVKFFLFNENAEVYLKFKLMSQFT